MPRLTLKTVNDELARRGYTARLEKGDGYFYFRFGEAADWLDRTVDLRATSPRQSSCSGCESVCRATVCV
jgi:hypothetical protein